MSAWNWSSVSFSNMSEGSIIYDTSHLVFCSTKKIAAPNGESLRFILPAFSSWVIYCFFAKIWREKTNMAAIKWNCFLLYINWAANFFSGDILWGRVVLKTFLYLFSMLLSLPLLQVLIHRLYCLSLPCSLLYLRFYVTTYIQLTAFLLQNSI